MHLKAQDSRPEAGSRKKEESFTIFNQKGHNVCPSSVCILRLVLFLSIWYVRWWRWLALLLLLHCAVVGAVALPPHCCYLLPLLLLLLLLLGNENVFAFFTFKAFAKSYAAVKFFAAFSRA